MNRNLTSLKALDLPPPSSERPIDRLVDGSRRFRARLDAQQRRMFAKLALSQSPHTLFITCCDSRIVPNLLTSTEPGELFLVRNVGNLVPPMGANSLPAEAAAVEYALEVLEVTEVVVCGHSSCGAMGAMLNGAPKPLPSVERWLADASVPVLASLPPGATPDDAARANVVQQLANLRTHPTVRAREAAGTLRLHGWFYDIADGDVSAWDPRARTFSSLHSEVV